MGITVLSVGLGTVWHHKPPEVPSGAPCCCGSGKHGAANPVGFGLNRNETKYVMLSFLIHVFTENVPWKRKGKKVF